MKFAAILAVLSLGGCTFVINLNGPATWIDGNENSVEALTEILSETSTDAKTDATATVDLAP